MEKLRSQLQQRFGIQRIRIEQRLQEYLPQTTISASLFLIVNDVKELVDAVTIASTHQEKYFVFDLEALELNGPEDFKGLVIKNNARRFDILARKGKIQSRQSITEYALVEAESGVPFNQLVRFTIDEGLGGIEEGLGLKGSVGSLFRSEKKYLETLNSQGIIQTLKVLSQTGEVSEVSLPEYDGKLLVLSVIFRLQGEDKKILWLKGQRAAERRGVSEQQPLT